jgi:hypothetical protein
MAAALGVAGRIDVRPFTAKDVEQLLEEMVSTLETSNLLTVFQTDWLPLPGAQREAARINTEMSLALRDAVTWLFLGNPLPDSFLGSVRGQLLTAEMIKEAQLVASDFLTDAIKLPKAPTRARQMTQYIQGVKRSLVDSGRITQEFWTDAFSSSPSKGGSEFAFGVVSAFERVRADVFTDLESIDREMDFVGRVRRSIRLHEIEPREEGVLPGDPNADFWFVMPDELDGQNVIAKRQINTLDAFREDLVTNPAGVVDRLLLESGIPTNAALYSTKEEKDALARLKALLVDGIVSAADQARFSGASPQDIAAAALIAAKGVLTQVPDAFEQARQRAVAAEQEEGFAERRIDTLGKADTALREWAAVNPEVELDPATTDQLKRLIFAFSQNFGVGSGLRPPSVAQIFSELGITPQAIRQKQAALGEAAQGKAIRAAALQSPDAIVENQLIRMELLRPDATPEQLEFLRDRFVDPISLALGIALRGDSQLDVEAFIRNQLGKLIDPERQVSSVPFAVSSLEDIEDEPSGAYPSTRETIPDAFQRLFREQEGVPTAEEVKKRTAAATADLQARDAAIKANPLDYVQSILRRLLPRDASPELLRFALEEVAPSISDALIRELLRRPSGPLSNVFFSREDFVTDLLREEFQSGDLNAPLPAIQGLGQAIQQRFEESEATAERRGLGRVGALLPETGGFPIVASPRPPSHEQRAALAEREFQPFRGLFREAAGESLPFLEFLTGQSGRVLQEFRGSEVPGVPLHEVEARLKVKPVITGGDPNAEPGFPDLGTGLLGETPTVRFPSSGERADLIRALGAPSRPTQERFFGGLLPTLRKEFRTSPGGLAEQLTTGLQAESERLAAEAETLVETARRQTTRQRRLRGGGRSVVVSRH